MTLNAKLSISMPQDKLLLKNKYAHPLDKSLIPTMPSSATALAWTKPPLKTNQRQKHLLSNKPKIINVPVKSATPAAAAALKTFPNNKNQIIKKEPPHKTNFTDYTNTKIFNFCSQTTFIIESKSVGVNNNKSFSVKTGSTRRSRRHEKTL